MINAKKTRQTLKFEIFLYGANSWDRSFLSR